MRPFAGRRILLGVTGGIACYKSISVARLLTQAGAEVDVVLTRGGREFVGPITFEAVTGRAVHGDMFAPGHALDHIRLARGASALVVAPATADFMARAAHGRADDLLTACLLATDAPVLLVPAMNDRMWAHPQTALNAAHLREIGYTVVDPDDGPLAVGEGSGPGRMPEPEDVVAHVGRLLEGRGSMTGLRVVVTAGPTREAVDPVRFLSNQSSGKMGVAVAAAASRRGAAVTLIAGPISVAPPLGVTTVRVESTAEMRDAVAAALGDADVLVMAAAPADFRPAEIAPRKIKKSAAPDAIRLVATDDILTSTIGRRRPDAVIVGFALETNDVLSGARAKLAAKRLDLVVANDATEEGAGFAVDTNRVTLLDARGGVEALPLLSKGEVADAILDRVESLAAAKRASGN
ncbi:MAG TPA: bifunctional phosphopantothenoylcysteine decarboxylase/phosphopantothenate--cysteine ligase CoaBC [Gemmatimonadaceae bacterium]|nr:bifunctional phosphopantothenoylcysteine decarboxylase/phosphopantothenate--cysteine ligase CoaBC [Gemmatimonadaceae bacterium]